MRTYTYGELKESKLIYDRKPPAFGIIMTLLTLALVIGALLWAAFSTKTSVVKASGLVADEQKTNIMNSVNGKIVTINTKEGQVVKKGDIILTIDSYQVELQIAQIQAIVDLYDEKISGITKLVDFVNGFLLDNALTQTNPFDPDDAKTIKLYSDADTFLDYVNAQKSQASAENKDYTQKDVDALKTQFLSQYAFGTLDEYLLQKAQQSSQLVMYQDSLEEYTIRAEQDGVVHLTAGLTIGTMLQAGMLLGNISQANNLYFDTVVSATERSKIQIGATVEIAVSGIIQTEYGVLTGKIEAIDTDSTQNDDGQIFFRIKIKPDKTVLTKKDGTSIEITVGMIGEARIKYDETTWLNWMIEQIGIKFN